MFAYRNVFYFDLLAPWVVKCASWVTTATDLPTVFKENVLLAA